MMGNRGLILWMADEFHDWIDGDDPVAEYHIVGPTSIWVKFESGAQFKISVQETFVKD